jgi:hypothetical protein
MMKACFSTILLVATLTLHCQAQEEYRNHYVFAPDPLSMFTANMSVGLALAILPQPLVESEVPLPAVDVRYRIGLPLNIGLVGRATSNYASTLVTAGPMWSVELTRVTVGGGLKAGFFYGHLTFLEGFNTSATGWLAYPFATVGVRFDDFTVSIAAEAEVLAQQQRRVEDIDVRSSDRTLNGGSLTVAIEQPFWKQTHIALGVTLAYSTNPYQAWLAFNTFDDRLFYPELFAGFIF